MISNVLRIKLHILLTDLLFQLSSSMNSKLSSQRNKIFLTVICERLRFDTRSVNIYISQKTIKHYEFAYRYCNFVCRTELFMVFYAFCEYLSYIKFHWENRNFVKLLIQDFYSYCYLFNHWHTTHNTSNQV